MPPLYDDEASKPLVGRDKSRSKKNGNGIIFNRIIVILLAAALVGISLYFQTKQKALSQQLATDESKIEQLSATVQSQEVIIKRFNDSVTNADVLTRLQSLERDLVNTKEGLQLQLQQTITDVNAQLNHTMDILDQTVIQAEAEISNQVEFVKKDFEQYMVKTQDQFSMQNSFMVYQLAGTITLLSCLISMWHMTAHLQKMNQPVIQRKILAILWMSPIYAVTSWFSLVFPVAEGYLAIIKDAYEAYVIYQFLSFCIAVLGKGDRAAVVDLLTKRADHLTPPFRLFPCCKRDPYENAHALADAILLQCQFFALQFVFFRPLTTIAKVVLAKYEYYGPWADNANDYRAPQLYITLIQNLSIFTAFTGLLKFYHAVDKDLEWCRPFAKFLCIKGVVFMTFWQGLAITILAQTTDVGGADAEEWAASAQNFLICLEMLLFSIAHFYCFPTNEWEDDYRANFHKAKYGIRDSMALGDFISDLKLVMKGNKKKSKKSRKKPSEPTVPEGDEDEHSDSERNDLDDATSVTSDVTGNTSYAEETKRSLAEDVKTVLTVDVPDPELEAVRQRISSFMDDVSILPGLLGGGVFVQQESTDDKSADGSENAGKQDHGYKQKDEEHEEEESPSHNDWAMGYDEEAPTEHTSLLGGSSSVSNLRPSIFTTIATMSEMEQNSPQRKNFDEEHDEDK